MFELAVATLQEELSLSKKSSLAEFSFSVGFNLSGRLEYICLALSIKIALALSSRSASVKPEKFLVVMA